MILLGNTLMNVLQECVTISMFCSSVWEERMKKKGDEEEKRFIDP